MGATETEKGLRMSFTADTLLLFGATGDLARRMLLPSLCALDADGLLPESLRIVGTARSPMSDSEYRNFARAALEKFLPANRRGRMADFLNRLHYQCNDVTTTEGFEALATQVGDSKHRLALIYIVVALAVILLSIPWPGMPAGRPLFRFSAAQ